MEVSASSAILTKWRLTEGMGLDWKEEVQTCFLQISNSWQVRCNRSWKMPFWDLYSLHSTTHDTERVKSEWPQAEQTLRKQMLTTTSMRCCFYSSFTMGFHVPQKGSDKKCEHNLQPTSDSDHLPRSSCNKPIKIVSAPRTIPQWAREIIPFHMYNSTELIPPACSGT